MSGIVFSICMHVRKRALASASAQACVRARALATWLRARTCYMSLLHATHARCHMAYTLSRVSDPGLMRAWLLALLLLVTLGLESWPDARLAPGFALARDSWLGILA